MLHITGFKRGMHLGPFQAHWRSIKDKLPMEIRLKDDPKHLVMKQFYQVQFPSTEIARKALGFLKDLEPWVDPRNSQSRRVYARMDTPLEQRKVGRFRSHFYQIIGDHLKNMDAHSNKW